MIRSALGVLGITCLFGGILSTFFMIYYLIVMHSCVRPEKKRILPFLGALQLFLPQMWNERGNRARTRLMISILAFAFFFSAVAVIVESSRH